MTAVREEIREQDAARGRNALLAAAGQMPPERLRLLRSVYGHACQLMRDRFFEAAGVTFGMTLEGLDVAAPARSALEGDGWLLALCAVKGQNTFSCIGLDAAAVNLFIEALLGGGAAGRTEAPQRAFTAFDHLLAGHAAEIVTGALLEAFAPSLEAQITIDEVKAAQEVEELELEERPVLAARLRVEALGEEGMVSILLPPGMFASMRVCALGQVPEAAAEEEGDSPWQETLDRQLRGSLVSCRAMMDGGEMTLGEVARLRPGQILELAPRQGLPVYLECDDKVLYLCRLGQADGVFTLKLQEAADEEVEFLQGVLDAGEGR